jgi:hypothetical protein
MSHFLLLLISLGFACTPIYQECTCKTNNLSCQIYEDIANNIADHVYSLLPSDTNLLKSDPAKYAKQAQEFSGLLLDWHFMTWQSLILSRLLLMG